MDNFDAVRSIQKNMDPISLGLGAIGLGSTIFGGIKSAQANKEMADIVKGQEAQAEAFYNKRANQDFMETNAAKGVVEALRKKYEKQAKTIDSNTAATGGTAEANIAAKSSLNDSYNDIMNSVAQQSTAYQTHAEDVYQNQQDSLARQRMALEAQKGQNATNLMQGGGQLLGAAADVAAMDNTGSTGTKLNTVVPSVQGISQENRTKLNSIANSAQVKVPSLNANRKTALTGRLGEDFITKEWWDSLNRGK